MPSNVHVLLPTAECRISVYPGIWCNPEYWAVQAALDCDVIISASPPPTDAAAIATWIEIDASRRLAWPAGARSVAVIGLMSCTSLSPLLFWDLAHGCPAEGVIVVVDLPSLLPQVSYHRRYFEGWMTCEETDDPLVARFVKRQASPAEEDRGLSDWSFCIPVDQPNASDLAAIAERITRMGLARTELMIACTQDYADSIPSDVRHLPVPDGATLTAKKNALAAAASYPNLCIFHDRVVLPINLGEAAERFGDHFPIVGLQNLYVNSEDLTIERYSDYHVENASSLNLIASVGTDGEPNTGLYREYLELRQSWRSSFVEASIYEYDSRCYMTGSLYIAKRAVWNICGQDERLDWGGLEDVEFGHRAVTEFGIPSRVNPFAFARTNRVRPILSEGQHFHLAGSWHEHDRRANKPAAIRFQKEPVFPISVFGYRERLLSFCDRWVSPFQRSEVNGLAATLDPNDPHEMMRTIIAILYYCVVRRDETELRAFLADLSTKVLMTKMDRAAETEIIAHVMRGEFLVDELVRNAYFRNMMVLAHKRKLFADHILPDADVLTARLLDIRRNHSSGIAYPGTFSDFINAVSATFV